MATWTSLLEMFVNPDHSSAEQATSLERICFLLHERKLTIQKVVKDMELYLTTTNSMIRARGILLLGEIISSLRMSPLESTSIHSLAIFFSSRLADWPALHGALIGCLSLLRRKDSIGVVTSDDARMLTQSYLENLNVQALVQKDRMLCLELMECLLESYGDAVSSLGEDLICGVCAAVDEEKDPCCLILVFRIIRLLIKLFPDPSCAEDTFEILSRYFPVSFKPPEEDKLGITREDLSGALLDVFSSSPLFATVCIPFLLEKLSSSLHIAKVDSLKYLGQCIKAYGEDAMSKHAVAVWDSLKTAIFSGTVGVSDTAIASETQDTKLQDEALACLRECISAFDRGNESSVLLQLLLEDKQLEDLLVPVKESTESDMNLNRNMLRPQVKMLGRLLYAASMSSFFSCFNISQKFLGSIFDSTTMYSETKVSELSSLHGNNVTNNIVRADAVYLCSIIVEANKIQADQICLQYPVDADAISSFYSLPLLKDLRRPLIDMFVSAVLAVDVSCNGNSQVDNGKSVLSHFGVNGLKLLASFPRPLSPLNDEHYIEILNFFLSLLNKFDSMIVIDEVPSALCDIGSSAEKFQNQQRVSLFADVVVSELLHKLCDDASSVTMPVMKAIAAVCNSNSVAATQVLEGFRHFVSRNLSKVNFEDGLSRIFEKVANVLECLSSVILPLCQKIGVNVNLIMLLPLDLWNSIKELADLLCCLPRKLLEAMMTTMRVSVQQCPEKLQVEILAKALDVISMEYLKLDFSSLVNYKTNQILERDASNSFGTMTRHEWQIGLFASVIVSLWPQVSIPDTRQVLHVLANFATATRDAMVSSVVAQALSSIINKFPTGDNNDLLADLDMDQAISLVLQDNLFKIVERSIFHRSSNPIVNEVSFVNGNILEDTAVYINAITTISWVGKGLAMRGHEGISEIAVLLLKIMQSKHSILPMVSYENYATKTREIDFLLAHAAADGICIIMKDSGTCLNRECHAQIRPLYKQRFFTSMIPILLMAIEDSTSYPMSRIMLYRALGHLISEAPQVVLLSESKMLLPFILDGILIANDGHENKDTVMSFLLALSGIIMDDDKGKSLILGNLSAAIARLVGSVGYVHSMMVRETSLQCLGALVALPHAQIFPYRIQVLKASSKAMDDRKRSVRKEAVRCHHAWASIASRTSLCVTC